MSWTSVVAQLRAALDPFEDICTFVRSASGPVAKAALDAVSSVRIRNARMQPGPCIFASRSRRVNSASKPTPLDCDNSNILCRHQRLV
jgi:hypothetical protein